MPLMTNIQTLPQQILAEAFAILVFGINENQSVQCRLTAVLLGLVLYNLCYAVHLEEKEDRS